MDVALTDGPVEIVNALDLDRTDSGISPRRLPAWTRPQIPDLFMEFMVTLGSGVRLAMRTDAPWIELDVHPTGFEVTNMPAPTIAYDLVVDGTRVAREVVDFGTRLVLDLATLRPLGPRRRGRHDSLRRAPRRHGRRDEGRRDLAVAGRGVRAA